MEFGQTREYSEEIAARIDREVASILARCYEKAKEILRDKKDRLDALVEALIKYETLNRTDFLSVMETGNIPETQTGDKEEEKKQRAEEESRKKTEAEDDDSRDDTELLN